MLGSRPPITLRAVHPPPPAPDPFRPRFRLRAMAWVGIAVLVLGVGGIVLLCWPDAAATGPRDTARGIALQIGASTSYAVHVLLLVAYVSVLFHLAKKAGTPAAAGH